MVRTKIEKVFVPYRGIYFLYKNKNGGKSNEIRKFSSPIGESTFSTEQRNRKICKRRGVFVPYRGIYFLYYVKVNATCKPIPVFVPYRGIYFLYGDSAKIGSSGYSGFSSPIGESTFSTHNKQNKQYSYMCFRPLSGNLLSLQ